MRTITNEYAQPAHPGEFIYVFILSQRVLVAAFWPSQLDGRLSSTLSRVADKGRALCRLKWHCVWSKALAEHQRAGWPCRMPMIFGRLSNI